MWYLPKWKFIVSGSNSMEYLHERLFPLRHERVSVIIGTEEYY